MNENPDIRACEGGLCLLLSGVVWHMCPKHYGEAVKAATKQAKGEK